MDLNVEFSIINDTRGMYIITWTPPLPSNGSYYQQLEYYFSSAYTVGPQYDGSVNVTLNQSENQYNISDALYFTNYNFTITTINIQYDISNGAVKIVNQSPSTGIENTYTEILYSRKFSRKFSKLTCFEHLVKESLAN